MDRSRKANRKRTEATLQHRSRNETQLIADLVEGNLAELQASIQRLQQTHEGNSELERRTKAFGECIRTPDETSAQFFAKLEHWLNRLIPQTKLPLHPPRQVDQATLPEIS